MQRNPLRTSALALAFVGSVGLAAAQQRPPPADPQQQSQQKAPARAGKPRPIGEQQTPSGKTGKEEHSSQAPNAKPEETAVFVNGALAVSGAPANPDTVPANSRLRLPDKSSAIVNDATECIEMKAMVVK